MTKVSMGQTELFASTHFSQSVNSAMLFPYLSQSILIAMKIKAEKCCKPTRDAITNFEITNLHFFKLYRYVLPIS